jgi:hypothetical protein
MIGQIDDLALTGSVDCAVRLVDEALQAFGVPVVASGLAFVAIHALLNDSPLAVIGDEEAMEIEFEAVLDGGAVDLGHQPTGTREAGPSVTCRSPKAELAGRAQRQSENLVEMRLVAVPADAGIVFGAENLRYSSAHATKGLDALDQRRQPSGMGSASRRRRKV